MDCRLDLQGEGGRAVGKDQTLVVALISSRIQSTAIAAQSPKFEIAAKQGQRRRGGLRGALQPQPRHHQSRFLAESKGQLNALDPIVWGEIVTTPDGAVGNSIHAQASRKALIRP